MLRRRSSTSPVCLSVIKLKFFIPRYLREGFEKKSGPFQLSSPGLKPQSPKPKNQKQRGLGLTLKSHGPPPHQTPPSGPPYLSNKKNLRWTARGRTWSSPPCSVRTSSVLLVAFRVDKFSAGRTKCRSLMLKRTWWNSLALFLLVNPQGEKKPYLGLDLIDPRSSSLLYLFLPHKICYFL